MRHHDKKRKLGLEANERRALLKSMARSLVLHGRIETTMAKAKELRPFVEKLVSKARIDQIANRRLVTARLGTGQVIDKLFKELSTKYKDRQGGYTRVLRVWRKMKDGSDRAIIEFV